MTRFKVGVSNSRSKHIEAAIRRARRMARGTGGSVEVTDTASGATVARVFPDGQVDATWAGSRIVSSHRRPDPPRQASLPFSSDPGLFTDVVDPAD